MEKVTIKGEVTKRQKTAEKDVSREEIVLENGKYVKKIITEKVKEPIFEDVDLYDEAGKIIIGKHSVPVMEEITEPDRTELVKKINPDYDPDKKWIPREERPEFVKVGLVGIVPIIKGAPTNPNWRKFGNTEDDMELWLIK